MSLIMLLIFLLSAGVVLVRCICVAASLNARDWTGHPLQFLGMAVGYAMLCGGALGMLLGFALAPQMLLVGVCCWIMFDRRGVCR